MRCRKTFTGVVFSNEFFDALPVDAVVYQDGAFREQRVDVRGRRFRGTPAKWLVPVRTITCAAIILPPQEGCWYEVNLEALAWLERMRGAVN